MSDSTHKSFLDEFLTYYPDPYGAVAASYSPDFMISLPYQPYEKLMVAADAVAQFIAHIRFHGNQINSQLSSLRSKFDKRLGDVIAELDTINDRTPSQLRMAKALKSDAQLSRLYDEIAKLEEKARLFDFMPDALREHLNILKLEIRTRQETRKFD